MNNLLALWTLFQQWLLLAPEGVDLATAFIALTPPTLGGDEIAGWVGDEDPEGAGIYAEFDTAQEGIAQLAELITAATAAQRPHLARLRARLAEMDLARAGYREGSVEYDELYAEQNAELAGELRSLLDGLLPD